MIVIPLRRTIKEDELHGARAKNCSKTKEMIGTDLKERSFDREFEMHRLQTRVGHLEMIVENILEEETDFITERENTERRFRQMGDRLERVEQERLDKRNRITPHYGCPREMGGVSVRSCLLDSHREGSCFGCGEGGHQMNRCPYAPRRGSQQLVGQGARYRNGRGSQRPFGGPRPWFQFRQ